MKNRIASVLGIALLAAAGTAVAADARQLAEADGLVTHELRIAAEQQVIAQLVETDGLVSTQLAEWNEYEAVARIAMADGLVVSISLPESSPETRSPGAVLLAATGR